MAWQMAAMMAAPMIAQALGGKKNRGPDYGPALQAIGGVGLPSIEDMKVQLQDLVSSGEITPEQADAILQQASSYEDIELDPYTREAQMQALNQMQDVYSAEGLDPIAKGRMAEAQQQFRTTEKGARDALLQRAQERGIGGSELSIANAMLGSQEGATTGAMQAQQASADANMRALQALEASGRMGGQIRGQDFEQEARVAQAQDAINQFNVMSRQQMQNQNIGRRESADYANLAERQRIGDYNTSMENQNRMYEANLHQQQYENAMRKAEATASIYGQQAQGQSQAAMQNQQMMGQMIGLGGQMGSAYLNYANRPNPTTDPTPTPTVGNQGQVSATVMPQNTQWAGNQQFGPPSFNKLDLRYEDPNKQRGYAKPFNNG